MSKSGLSGLMRQGEETLSFIFCLMMGAIFPFFLSSGYQKAGTDKGLLYIYLAGAFCILGLMLYSVYLLSNVGALKPLRSFRALDLSDRFMLLYFVIINISFLLSPNRDRALIGEGGWYQGYLPSVFLVCSYFFISRFLTKTTCIIAVLCIVSGFQFILGAVNRLGFYPIKYEGIESGFISTLGNINWFCGFWSLFFGLAIGLFYKVKSRGLSVLCGVLLAVGSFSGALQGSDSALFVFTAGMIAILVCGLKGEREDRIRAHLTCGIIFAPLALTFLVLKITGKSLNLEALILDLFAYSPFAMVLCIISFVMAFLAFKAPEDKERDLYKVYMTLVLSILGLIVFTAILLILLNTFSENGIELLKDKPFFTLDYNWGNLRGYTWTAGFSVFRDGGVLQKLIGWGPDCFAFAVYKNGSSCYALMKEAFGDSRLTNAHCEWLTVLGNFGILGLVSFMGMELTKIKALFQTKMAIPFACGIATLGYVSNNLFSFAQPVNIPYLFILMGIGTAVLRSVED